MTSKASRQDIDSLAELFNSYRMFYDKKSDVQGAKQFLSERLDKNDSEIIIVKHEGEIKGFVQLYPLFSSTRMKKYWLLNDLFVDKQARGKGLSKMLLSHAQEICKESDACGILLETSQTNDIGNNLYPSAGFKKYEGVNFYEWTPEE